MHSYTTEQQARIAKVREQALRRAQMFSHRDDAEEIANEVVIYFIEKGMPERFPIRRRVIDIIRTRTQYRGNTYADVIRAIREASIASEDLESLPAEQSSVLKKLISEDEFNRFRYSLDPIQCCIVTLFAVWGFKGKEIAECLGITPARVSYLLSEALEQV